MVMAKWTKCAWKMPDNDRDVLFCNKMGGMFVGFYDRERDQICNGHDYISYTLIPCWCELPPKPNF